MFTVGIGPPVKLSQGPVCIQEELQRYSLCYEDEAVVYR